MWDQSYKDYPRDGEMRKIRIESGKGMQGGCEMGEVYGWSLSHQLETPSSDPSILTTLSWVFCGKKETKRDVDT